MAEKYEQVLAALRQVDSEKLEEAEAAFKERSGWLAQAVAEARSRFTAAKQASSQSNTLVDKENVKQPAPKRGGRSRRKPPAQLETVEEEETESADKATTAEPASRDTPASQRDEDAAAGEGSATQQDEGAAQPDDVPPLDGSGAGLATAVEPEPQKRSEQARGKSKKGEPAELQEPPRTAPLTRATRSRRGAIADASTNSVTHFPSPPRARKGRGKAKKVKEPTPVHSKDPAPLPAAAAKITSHKLSLEPSPAVESPQQTAQPAEEADRAPDRNQGNAAAVGVGEDAVGEDTPELHAEAPVSEAEQYPAEAYSDAEAPVLVNEVAAVFQPVIPESDVEEEEEAPVNSSQGKCPDVGAEFAAQRDSGVISRSAVGTPAVEVGLALGGRAPPSSLASRATRRTQVAAADTPAAVSASGLSPPRTRSRLQARSTQSKQPVRARPTPTPLHASTAKELETATPGEDISPDTSNTPANDTSAQPNARVSIASAELASAEQPRDEQELQQGAGDCFRNGDSIVGQDTQEMKPQAAELGDSARVEVRVSESSGGALQRDIVDTRRPSGKPCQLPCLEGDADDNQVPLATAAILEGGKGKAKLVENAEEGEQAERVPDTSNEAEQDPDASRIVNVCEGPEETVYHTQDIQELDTEDEEAAVQEEADAQELLQEPDAAPQNKNADVQLGGGVRNLVSSIRSFLPTASKSEAPAAGKKAPEVEALKAAQAARRREAAKEAERLKQKEALIRQKADRAKHTQNVKAKQEAAQKQAADEAKRREEALKKKEEEAASRRRAKEEAEKKEREERQRKLDELRAKKRQEEARKKDERQEEKKDAGKKRAAEDDKPKGKVELQIQELEAKRARIETAAASQSNLPAAHAAAQSIIVPPVALVKTAATAAPPSAHPAALQYPPEEKPAIVAPPAVPPQLTAQAAPAMPESIEIAPYRSDDDTDEEEEEQQKQMLPAWAQEPALRRQLVAQQRLDPDEIFQQHQKTCSLDEVFDHASTGRDPKSKDFNRRSSSGNWLEDRVTWKEEMNYKKAMGYI